MRSTISLLVIAAAALAGCASGGAVPADRLATSKAAVKSAEDMGAAKDPTAALHLRLAREQLEVGRKLIIDGDTDRARLVLMRAEADADVALNLSRERAAKMAAAKANDDLRAVRSSMPSTSKEGM